MHAIVAKRYSVIVILGGNEIDRENCMVNSVAPMRRLVSPKGEGRYARPFLLKGEMKEKGDHRFGPERQFSKGL